MIIDDIWKSISEEAKDLIKKMIVSPEEKRISAKEAYDHPWFKANIRSHSKGVTTNVLKNLKAFKVLIFISSLGRTKVEASNFNVPQPAKYER